MCASEYANVVGRNKFVELTANVFEIIFIKYMYMKRSFKKKHEKRPSGTP